MTGIFDNGFRGTAAERDHLCKPQNMAAVSAGPGYFPWNNANPTYTYKDNLTKIIGNHNLFIGASIIAAPEE